MTIDEFISVDKQVGILGEYRVIETDINVGIVKTDVNMTTYVIDNDVQDMIDKMGVKRYYSVIDIRNMVWVSNDTKNWIKGEKAAKVVRGYALIAATPLSSMLADLWVLVNNLPFPVKKFRDFQEGLNWIRALKAEHLKEEAERRA